MPKPTAAPTDSDGFQSTCRYCGGELSPIAWNDLRLSCDNCGEVA